MLPPPCWLQLAYPNNTFWEVALWFGSSLCGVATFYITLFNLDEFFEFWEQQSRFGFLWAAVLLYLLLAEFCVTILERVGGFNLDVPGRLRNWLADGPDRLGIGLLLPQMI